MQQPFLIAILVLVFLVVFLLLRQVKLYWEEQRNRQRLGLKDRPQPVQSGFLKLMRPLYLLLVPFCAGIQMASWREKRKKQLIVADLQDELSLDELLALKVVMSLLLVGFLAWFCFVMHKSPAWWIWALFLAGGYYLPDFWVIQQAENRSKEIKRSLPFAVDLLALCVESGMDLKEALQRLVVKSEPNALTEEFARMVKEESYLQITREQALRNLALRCDVAELTTLMSILAQGERLGVPISETMRAQSSNLRIRRFQEAERLAGQATQKILFPMILCIMPAMFLVIIGPLMIKFFFQ